MNDRELRLWMIRSAVGVGAFAIALCSIIVIVSNPSIHTLIQYAPVAGALTIVTIVFGFKAYTLHHRLCALEEEMGEKNETRY